MTEISGFEPKIYFRQDTGAGGGGPEDLFAAGGSPEQLEQYLESLRGAAVGERYDSGRAIEATLSRHPNPEALLAAVRVERLEEENLETGGEMRNDYVVGRMADILKDRKIATGRAWEELKSEELLQELDEETLERLREMRGKGLLSKAVEHERYFARAIHVGGYGLGETGISRDAIDSYERKDGKKVNIRFRTTTETLTYFGSDEKRKEFSDRCDELRGEMLVRHLHVGNWSRYRFHRENLTGLVQLYYGPFPTTEGLRRLYNLRQREGAATETVTGVELRSLGDKIDMARRLYYINALSEKRSRFLRLMDRPGWRQFIFPEGTSREVIQEWIGKPGEWVLEEKPETEAETKRRGRADKRRRTKKTLQVEKIAGRRGRLTQGNIFAATEVTRNSKLDEAIREFIGGGEKVSKKNQEEAMAAQQIAYREFKTRLQADEEGWEVYYDDDPKSQYDPIDPLAGKIVSFENGPAASDFGKLTSPWLYMVKSWRRGRDYAPPSGFANAKVGYERFCVSDLRHITVPYKVKVKLPGGTTVRSEQRSLEELWWGYPEEEMEIMVDGERTKASYPAEPGIRLGDMPWSEIKKGGKELTKEEAGLFGLPEEVVLHEEDLAGIYLSAFMAGREDTGVYQLITSTGISERELTDLGFWRRFWKALDVGIKDGVTVYGEFRGRTQDEIDVAKKARKIRVVETLVRGIQSLPQWKTWEEESRRYYDRGAGRKIEKTVAQRVLEVAKEAFKQYNVELEILSPKVLNTPQKA